MEDEKKGKILFDKATEAYKLQNYKEVLINVILRH